MATTPTGIRIIDCPQCGHIHPVTRTHCPVCGLAHLFDCRDRREQHLQEALEADAEGSST